MGDQKENPPGLRSFLRNRWFGLVELALLLVLFLLGPWYDDWVKKPAAPDAPATEAPLDGGSWIAGAWAWVVESAFLLGWAIVVLGLAHWWRRRGEKLWATALVSAEDRASTAESEKASIERHMREREVSIGDTIRSLNDELTATKVSLQSAEAARTDVEQECANWHEESDELRAKLTPPSDIAEQIKRLDEHRRTVGHYTFSALWALSEIADASQVLTRARSDGGEIQWTSVVCVVAWAHKFTPLPNSKTNVENSLHQVGPLVQSLPPECVENKYDGNGHIQYFIRPHGRRLLFWAELLGVSVKPIRLVPA